MLGLGLVLPPERSLDQHLDGYVPLCELLKCSHIFVLVPLSVALWIRDVYAFANPVHTLPCTSMPWLHSGCVHSGLGGMRGKVKVEQWMDARCN